jgi:hypothetical protein
VNAMHNTKRTLRTGNVPYVHGHLGRVTYYFLFFHARVRATRERIRRIPVRKVRWTLEEVTNYPSVTSVNDETAIHAANYPSATSVTLKSSHMANYPSAASAQHNRLQKP